MCNLVTLYNRLFEIFRHEDCRKKELIEIGKPNQCGARGKVATLAEAQTAMLARFSGWQLPPLQDRPFIIPRGLRLFGDVK